MKFTNPQRGENQIYAKFDYECRMRGSQMMAYVPVVAGGSNALTMHYVNNDQPLHDGDLLLMDAGGELNGYASDITRTWPVNGKFTQAQRDLYEVVLNANKECIKASESNNRRQKMKRNDPFLTCLRFVILTVVYGGARSFTEPDS